MSTQGLLSITHNGVVVAKIVTGSNGYNMPVLAASLRRSATVDPQELLQRCKEHDLGGGSTIVQYSPTEWVSDGEIDELPKLYRETFFDPRFNPRWLHGTAEYVEIVELDMGGPKSTEILPTCSICGGFHDENKCVFGKP